MPTTIGQPGLVGAPNLVGEPALVGAPTLATPSFLFGRATPFIPQDGTAAGFTAPTFAFQVATRTGELNRMWVKASGSEAVFDLRPGNEAGEVWQDSPHMLDGTLLLNRLRVFSSGANMRLHASGGFLSTWAQDNDGGVDEPNLALFFYTSATAFQERRLADRSSVGGGFINWNNNTGVLAGFFGTLLTADTELVIVLADATT